MIDFATVKALRDHLAEKHGLTYVDPRDAGVALLRQIATVSARAGMTFLGTLVGLPSTTIESAVPDLSRTSVALGKFILLSEAAVTDPVEELDTTVHEAQHGVDTEADGSIFKAGLNYTQAELRAQREARAAVAGMFARYLVTGAPLTAGSVAEHLRHGPYHLGPNDLELARGIARSHVATIASGVCPPITAAIDTLAWLRTHAPEKIVAEGWR